MYLHPLNLFKGRCEIIDGLIELTFCSVGDSTIDVELSIFRLILFLLSGGIGEQKEKNY